MSGRQSKADKEKSFQERKSALDLKYGQMMKPDLVDLGSEIMNAVIAQGGCPRGVFIELAASFGVGKSTALLHVAKRFCQRGEEVYYCDVETGVNELQMDGIGVLPYLHSAENPTGLFHLLTPQTFEEVDEIFYAFVNDVKPPLVILDSITSLLPEKLLEKSIAEIEPGLQARYTSNFLMKYKHACKNNGTITFFVNQVRTQIRFRGVSTVEPAGGNALKHFMDIRLMLELDKSLTRTLSNMSGKESVPYGSLLKLFSIKNRWAPPFISLRLAVYFGKGISNIWSYVEFLQMHGICDKGSSGVYTVKLNGQEHKCRGFPKLEEWVKANIKEVKDFVTENGGFQLIPGDAQEEEDE